MNAMKTEFQLLSIQVGLPKTHMEADAISNKPWESGIFKAPVTGKIGLGALNLAGDGQQDLRVHGGPFRAVLAYSAEHYPIWREELQMPNLPYGAFGENFTVSGLDENTVSIGDIFELGGVLIQVTQPRQPCWKLARRWGIKDLTARVYDKGWGGWYHRVLQEGYVEAGMTLRMVDRPYPEFTIERVNALMNEWMDEPEVLAVLAEMEPLSPGWRTHFAEKMKATTSLT
ncbi:MAG TPA: MOSC domain-containing protein [Phototrophicaceae bacterium]|jgi:MOSC domain-containing protein YiiM|nr:MOSC domain-containing protein [Phototrophicaceae bacterium]